MKKWFIALMILSLLAVTGCGNSAVVPSSGQQSDNAGKLTDVSLVLDWYPNAVHSFIYAAQENGYFKQEGLNVHIQMPSDTNDPIKLVAAGQYTFGLTYQPEVVLARSQGVKVKSIAAVVRKPLNIVMVPENSPIKSPKDLMGHSVGYPSIPIDESFINTMVKSDGGDPARVKMTDVGWDIMTALSTHKVDAVIGGYINHEYLVLKKQGLNTRFFSLTDNGVPNYNELVMVAGDDTVSKNPDTVTRFWKALQMGQAFVEKHPDQGLDILFKSQSKDFPLEKDVETQSLHMLIPIMMDEHGAFGGQTEQSWTNVEQWMKRTGQIQGDVNPSDCFVDLTGK